LSSLAIARRELLEIAGNRKFMLAFGVQTLLLLLLLPAFGNVFESGNLALPSPTLQGFVPLGVVVESDDCDVLLQALEANRRLRLYRFSSPPVEELERGVIAGYLLIPESYREGSLTQLEVVLVLGGGVKSSVAQDAVEESVAEASSRIAAQRRSELELNLESAVSVRREFLRQVVVEGAGGERFSSFFLSYLVPLVLFFPVFMSGGVVLDAIAGERERRTIESLLGAPLSRKSIVSGKFLALWGFVSAEVAVWLLGIGVMGIPVAKPVEAMVLLAGVNALVIALAMALTLYSRSLKEANIALMLLYVPLFVGLIYALSVEFFSPRDFFSYIPFNLISRAVTGEGFSHEVLLQVLLLLGFGTLLCIATAVLLIERDDVVFGSRPGIGRLFSDACEALLGAGFAGGMALALLMSPLVFVTAVLVEVALALLYTGLLGYSAKAVYLTVFSIAVTEELLKLLPLRVALRKQRSWLTARASAAIGAASATGFFIMETLAVGAAVLVVFGIPLTKLLYARATTTLVMHTLASSIAALGLYRRKKLGTVLIVLAILLHAVFNLAVVEVVL